MNQNANRFAPRRLMAPALLLAPLAALFCLTLPEGGQSQAAQASAADKNLDIALLRQAPKILKFLSDNDYKSVGILPFKVKKGTRQAGYYSAPLATNLPGRLENALIMGMGDDEKSALHIIRDAASTANQKKVGKWSKSKASFNKLFSVSYPLAWGSKQVRPDIFLTGVVTNTGDRSTTTVEIEAFTKKDWSGSAVKRSRVLKFTVKTNRALLRDLGYSYALAARSVTRRGYTVVRRDAEAVDQVNREENGEKPAQGGQAAHTPDDVAGMGVEIYYDDVKQNVRPLTESADGARSPLYQVDPMPAGAKVTVVLTRVSEEDRRLGVILKVNGLSTYKLDDRDSLQCNKWLYDLSDRGKPDQFHGFWMDSSGKDVRPFTVLTAEESATKASELGERAGWIDIDVFASGEEPQPEEQMMVSTKGLARGARKVKTLKTLQARLMKANNVRARKSKVVMRGGGGLLIPGAEPVPGAVLTESEKLPNPVRLGGISIKYYDRSSMSVSE
jgi:hypothetical protein